MHLFERCCIAIRHSPGLDQADWLWNRLRPRYEMMLALLGRKGLERTINNTDRILVLPSFRGVAETYEPQLWKHLMAQVRPVDIVADVGAFIGLYTIALAKRVGPAGKVVAFEPDPENFNTLKAHVELNRVSDRVKLIRAAVGARDGTVLFETGRSSESHISHIPGNGTQIAQCISLDTAFADRRLDVLKVDVEGYEEEVLKGGLNLLGDPHYKPRIIYIEVHPYAWPAVETSSESLLNLLRRLNYQVATLDRKPIDQIRSWQKIVAHSQEWPGSY